MRWKKIAKTLLIVLVSVTVLGGLAFATFVYNPFEGSFGEIREAVPTDVDFYLSKKNLGDDFEEFPAPVFWGSFEAAPWWRRVAEGGVYKDADRDVRGVLNQLRDVNEQMKQVPMLGLDILGDGIGRDLAVVGKHRANGGYEFCAYSRVSWKIRAAFSLLGYDFVRSRLQGVQIAEEEDGLFKITGNSPEPFFLTRLQDLVIAGNSLALVKRSRDLGKGGEGDVMFASADYNDQLRRPADEWAERSSQDPNAVETMLNVEALRRSSPEFAAWPGRGPDVGREARLLELFLNPGAMRRMWTSVIFENPAGLTLLGRLAVNNGQLTDFQKRFHAEPSGSVERWLKPTLALVPSTAAMAAILRLPPGAFLLELFGVLERPAQELIQDGLKRSGIRGGMRGLVERVAPGLEPWVGIVFRNNDYPPIVGKDGKLQEFKVFIPSPAPAWALIFRAVTGEEVRVNKLIKAFREQLRFNLDFNGSGMQMRSGPGNQILIQEWGNRHIEATGQIALFFDDKGSRYFLISNSGKLLREVINARYGIDGSRSIMTTNTFADILPTLPSSLSGFAWFQGDRCRQVTAKYREFYRTATASTYIDQVWAKDNRPAIQARILQQQFAGKARSAADLRGSDKKRFEKLVADELERMWSRERVQIGKDEDRKFAELGAWLDYLEAGYLCLRAKPKDLTIEVRAFPRW